MLYGFPGGKFHLDGFVFHQQSGGGQAYQAGQHKRKHQPEIASGGQMEFLIKEQALGISHRRGHAAQIGGDGLKDDEINQILPPLDH